MQKDIFLKSSLRLFRGNVVRFTDYSLVAIHYITSFYQIVLLLFYNNHIKINE